MSRLAVRTEINTRLAQWAILNNIAFHETLNENAVITDLIWCTVEFFAEFTEKLCYSGFKKRENGTIDITIFQESGSGDDFGVSLCDSVQDFFESLVMQHLEITEIVAANEFAGGDGSGRVSGWVVSMTYIFNY